MTYTKKTISEALDSARAAVADVQSGSGGSVMTTSTGARVVDVLDYINLTGTAPEKVTGTTAQILWNGWLKGRK